MVLNEIPDALFVAQSLFWLLLPIVLFGPRWWALVAWLAMTNLDATGPSSAVNSSVGWINVFKNFGLPLYLILRAREVRSHIWHSFPAVTWMLLTGYAALAVIWSSYQLAAVKMIANMIGIMLILVLLEKYCRLGLLNTDLIVVYAAVSIALAIGQTYIIGDGTFGYDGIDQAVRFTSFIGAQHYAALLVALLSVFLFMKPLCRPTRAAFVTVLLVAILLNGSRTWFLGAFAVLAVYSIMKARTVFTWASLALALLVLAVLLASNFGMLDPHRYTHTESRIVATANAVFAGQDTPNRAGLRNFTFRTWVYAGVVDELRSTSVVRLFFGHGTSNGADVADIVLPRYYKADPNRIIHNEWLRIQFEWGLVGFVLWSLTSVGVMTAALRRFRSHRRIWYAESFLAYMPAIAIALMTENILAGAGSAVSVGFSLLLVGAVTLRTPASNVVFLSSPKPTLLTNAGCVAEVPTY